jgi:hypothetical protein
MNNSECTSGEKSGGQMELNRGNEKVGNRSASIDPHSDSGDSGNSPTRSYLDAVLNIDDSKELYRDGSPNLGSHTSSGKENKYAAQMKRA